MNLIPLSPPFSPGSSLIRYLSALSAKFDSWLYAFFKDRFGILEPNSGSRKHIERKNRGLTKLRQQKKELKIARKAILKAGLKGTEVEKNLPKQWFSIIRQHNKLRKAIEQKQQRKSALAAERKFRQNRINLQNSSLKAKLS